MKISWGIKITAVYIGFVVFILCMVMMAMRQNVELVSTDYYEQELKFQEKINKAKRSNELKDPLTWVVEEDQILLKIPSQFSGQEVKGNIYFFRPSDATLDKNIPIQPDTNTIKTISLEKLKKGLYKMQINWEVNKIEYYNEGIIQVN